MVVFFRDDISAEICGFWSTWGTSLKSWENRIRIGTNAQSKGQPSMSEEHAALLEWTMGRALLKL